MLYWCHLLVIYSIKVQCSDHLCWEFLKPSMWAFLWSNPCKIFGHNFATLLHKTSQSGIKAPKYQISSIIAKKTSKYVKNSQNGRKTQKKYQTWSKNQYDGLNISKKWQKLPLYLPGSTWWFTDHVILVSFSLLYLSVTVIADALGIFEALHLGFFCGAILAKNLATISAMVFPVGQAELSFASDARIDLRIVCPLPAALSGQINCNRNKKSC